jgi:hypothetical protein
MWGRSATALLWWVLPFFSPRFDQQRLTPNESAAGKYYHNIFRQLARPTDRKAVMMTQSQCQAQLATGTRTRTVAPFSILAICIFKMKERRQTTQHLWAIAPSSPIGGGAPPVCKPARRNI